MAILLIALVIIVGFVLLLSRSSARRERRLPPHLSFLLEGPVVRNGRPRRLLAWLRRVLIEADDRSRGWPSGGGFGGFGGFGGCGGGGCGGSGGC
jgi:hypothetical protein